MQNTMRDYTQAQMQDESTQLTGQFRLLASIGSTVLGLDLISVPTADNYYNNSQSLQTTGQHSTQQ